MKFNSEAFLVVTTTIGFFTLIGVLVFREVPDGSREIVAQLIGGIAAAFGAIIGYRFGSSSGSARKTDIINTMAGTGDGTGTTTTTTKTDSTKTVSSETPPVPKVEP